MINHISQILFFVVADLVHIKPQLVLFSLLSLCVSKNVREEGGKGEGRKGKGYTCQLVPKAQSREDDSDDAV